MFIAACVCVRVVSPAYTFLTLDVIEAMCSCLIAEAEHGEQSRRSDVDQELHIIGEFGRCLTQVIDSAGRTRGRQRRCHLLYLAVAKPAAGCTSAVYVRFSLFGTMLSDWLYMGFGAVRKWVQVS